jgi:hypothetical protein
MPFPATWIRLGHRYPRLVAGPSGLERNVQWVHEVAAATQPFSTGGVSVNFLGEEGEDQVKAAYGSHDQRLVALKRTYDPTNLFRLNQNIQPTA